MSFPQENTEKQNPLENPQSPISKLQDFAMQLEQTQMLRNKGPQKLSEELQRIQQESPEADIHAVQEELTRLGEELKQAEYQEAHHLTEQIIATLEEKKAETGWIEEKKSLSRTYLRNVTDRKKGLLQPYALNPFNGTLEGKALVIYETADGSIDRNAEDNQLALEGLPNFEEDEKTPKIYRAIGPQGETRTIYWVPNLEGRPDLGGHFAQKSQRKEIHAIIPHGWIIEEIEEEEAQVERIEIEKEEKHGKTVQKDLSQYTAQVQSAIQKEIQEGAAHTEQEPSLTTREQPALLHIMHLNNEEIIKILATMPQEETRKEGAEMTQAESKSLEIDAQTPQEVTAVLFDKIKIFLASFIQSRETGEKLEPTIQKEASQAIIFLDEVYANIQKEMFGETVTQDELLGETTVTQEELLMMDEAAIIIERSRKNLAQLRALTQNYGNELL